MPGPFKGYSMFHLVSNKYGKIGFVFDKLFSLYLFPEECVFEIGREYSVRLCTWIKAVKLGPIAIYWSRRRNKC